MPAGSGLSSGHSSHTERNGAKAWPIQSIPALGVEGDDTCAMRRFVCLCGSAVRRDEIVSHCLPRPVRHREPLMCFAKGSLDETCRSRMSDSRTPSTMQGAAQVAQRSSRRLRIPRCQRGKRVRLHLRIDLAILRRRVVDARPAEAVAGGKVGRCSEDRLRGQQTGRVGVENTNQAG